MEEELKNLLNEAKEIIKNCVKSKEPFDYSHSNFSGKSKKIFDLIEKHNYSYAVNLILSKLNYLDDIAIKYRDNKYTYKELFTNSYSIAKALKKNNIKTVLVAATNTPEFISLFLASSMIGVKIDSMGDWFNGDYMVERINKYGEQHFFTDDLTYCKIKQSLDKSNIKKIIMYSISDSLPIKNGKKYNPYAKVENKFHTFDNKVDEFINNSSKKIIKLNDFINDAKEYDDKVLAKTDLNDVMTTTYTSGTTSPGRPKPVNQTIRSYVSYSFGMQKSVPSLFSLRGLSYMNNIPPDTHITLSMISALMYQGSIIIPEPFYSVDFFPYAVRINDANILTNSNPEYENLCNLLENDPKWKNINLKNLAFAIVTGESTSKGQEKYYNMVARKHKFGSNVYHYPITPTKFSIGGGTTEGTGVLITPYKALLEKIDPRYNLTGKNMGLEPMIVSKFKVLNKNGDFASPMEDGLIVEDSPCIMDGYDADIDNNFIYINGHKWLSTSTYGYIDKAGSIFFKGRKGYNKVLTDGTVYQFYNISDVIEKDTKNIKCAIISYDGEKVVVNYKFQNDTKMSKEKIISSMIKRILKYVPKEVQDILYLRNFDVYPVEPSGKISLETFKEDNINITKFSEYINQDKVLVKKYKK